MWNKISPTNSKKLLIDNAHIGEYYGNGSTKISVAMEIHIQNKCISA